MDSIINKENNLKEYLRRLNKVAIAFSAGVDSTYLLDVALECLGKENVLVLTAFLHSVPQREKEEAVNFCSKTGAKHVVVDMDELNIEGFSNNPPDRCYICKKAVFSELLKTAKANGFDALAEGSNLDDNNDYRPGMKAIKELDVKSPLREALLTKGDIRKLSELRGLETYNKPSFACLSSRFVYGETINATKLQMVEYAEDYLIKLGFSQFRVRIHGDKNYLARIEILKEEFSKILNGENRSLIADYFKSIGFAYVTMDILGYRTGSMNEVIK